MCQWWRGRGVLLDGADDPCHRPHGFQRVGAHRRLTGEHHRVGSVEHRVGNVRGLRPGGPRVLDHRLEHLGGHDDRLGVLPRNLDGPLLYQRDLLEWQFHTKIAARDHHRVEGQHDGFKVGNRFGLFEFRDHRDAATDAVHHLVHQLDVGR